jgi:hypothetical protein
MRPVAALQETRDLWEHREDLTHDLIDILWCKHSGALAKAAITAAVAVCGHGLLRLSQHDRQHRHKLAHYFADVMLGKIALAPGTISSALAPTTYVWLTELAKGGLTQPSLLAVRVL